MGFAMEYNRTDHGAAQRYSEPRVGNIKFIECCRTHATHTGRAKHELIIEQCSAAEYELIIEQSSAAEYKLVNERYFVL